MKRFYVIGIVIFTIVWPNASATMGVDTELFLIDESLLRERVIPAVSAFLDHGDPTAARQLVEEAISTQQFQATVNSDSYRERTTAQYLANSSKELLGGKLPKEILDDHGTTIRDPKLVRRRQTEIILSPFLVLFLCAWSKDGTQTNISLSHGQFVGYLRSNSPWMEDFLGSSNELLWNAADIPLAIGGDAKLLAKEEAGVLLRKLKEVPLPSGGQELMDQYEMLRQLLQIAVENPRFRVLIRTT